MLRELKPTNTSLRNTITTLVVRGGMFGLVFLFFSCGDGRTTLDNRMYEKFMSDCSQLVKMVLEP